MRSLMRFDIFFLGFAFMSASPAHADQMPHRYVIIVANNYSLDKDVTPLKFADDDGARYYELFSLSTDRVALFSVFDDETAQLFPAAAEATEPPSAEAIFRTLNHWNQEMADEARRGQTSELFFIFAGHGDVDSSGEGYVNLLHSKLRRSDLYQKILAPSRASYIHLIIDACKSYYLVNRRGKKWKDDTAPMTHDEEIKAFLDRENLFAYPNVGVILATSGDSATHEWNRYRGGILSHGLRSALVGSADINGDGRIEYSEMHAFLAAATSRVMHPEVKLQIFARPPPANRHQALYDLRNAKSARFLRFDAQLQGRFFLEDDRGIRYADLNKSDGISFEMAVDRQRTYYIYRDHLEAKILPGISHVVVASLNFKTSEMAMRGSLDQTFRKDLFITEYSRGFYDGFCTRAGISPVAGDAVKLVIQNPEDLAEKGHALLLGYIANEAILDLKGVNHGINLLYQFIFHPHISVGAVLEFARSSNTNPKGESFHLDRFAALLGATAQTSFLPWLSGRTELFLGYQGLFGSGPVWLNGVDVEGSSDPLGFRLELGVGARVKLSQHFFADLRGGLGIDLVTIEYNTSSEEFAHTTPYLGLGFGAKL